MLRHAGHCHGDRVQILAWPADAPLDRTIDGAAPAYPARRCHRRRRACRGSRALRSAPSPRTSRHRGRSVRARRPACASARRYGNRNSRSRDACGVWPSDDLPLVPPKPMPASETVCECAAPSQRRRRRRPAWLSSTRAERPFRAVSTGRAERALDDRSSSIVKQSLRPSPSGSHCRPRPPCWC